MNDLKERLVNGDRVSLGRSLTLIESALESDQVKAQQLLEEILPVTGNSIRIGITGVPGVGKSTFIEAFGLHVIGLGKKVAVLTIDPTSQVTRGSILGDKTRMPGLSNSSSAFIRPSASGSALGGVAYKTRESILLCEAAGYDVIIIETVGVGQTEVAVRNMVDFFLLLMLAGAGDELQGIKKGIMEMADGVLITKADGENERNALEAKSEYQHALHLFRSKEEHWYPKVSTCSARDNKGIAEAWEMIQEFQQQAQQTGKFEILRKQQLLSWMNDQFDFLLRSKLTTNQSIKQTKTQLELEVLNNKITPFKAADQLLRAILQNQK